MKSIKQFSIGALLVAVSVFAGFLAGHVNGFRHGLSKWRSLPMETDAFPVHRIVGTGVDSEQKLLDLIQDIKSNVVPEFWANDPDLSITPEAPASAVGKPSPTIVVRGNVVVQETIGRYLYELEMETLLNSSNGELTKAAMLQYNRAKDTYFKMKDTVGD